jgi:hypothetical protein
VPLPFAGSAPDWSVASSAGGGASSEGGGPDCWLCGNSIAAAKNAIATIVDNIVNPQHVSVRHVSTRTAADASLEPQTSRIISSSQLQHPDHAFVSKSIIIAPNIGEKFTFKNRMTAQRWNVAMQ